VSVRKRFGQHFLEPAWAARLVAAIAPQPEDTFIEIGPGRGELTLPLAHRVRRVIAIEIDRDLAAGLVRRLPQNAQLVVADVLEIDLAELVPRDDGAFRLAGNLPYNISSPIVGRLLSVHQRDARLTDATLMLQREVADRLAAAPGSRDYGVLSVSAQRLARISRLLDLPPGAFRPPPKVHSAVIRLAFRTGGDRIQAPPLLDSVVRSAFGQRRKRVSNALRALAGSLGVSAGDVLQAAGIDPGRRPGTLTVEEFVTLAYAFEASRPQGRSA
jgi:16S rRNA (adenine1518-N6/adenine1519-N6)-dimethyltransferase